MPTLIDLLRILEVLLLKVDHIFVSFQHPTHKSLLLHCLLTNSSLSINNVVFDLSAAHALQHLKISAELLLSPRFGGLISSQCVFASFCGFSTFLWFKVYQVGPYSLINIGFDRRSQ